LLKQQDLYPGSVNKAVIVCFPTVYPDRCKIKEVGKNYMHTKKTGVFNEKDKKFYIWFDVRKQIHGQSWLLSSRI